MPPFFLASAAEIVILGVVLVLTLPVWCLVHLALQRCYLMHARRFCRKHGYKLLRSRWRPARDNSGIKTELTLFELDCRDKNSQRRLVRLLIWIFGTRKVLTDE